VREGLTRIIVDWSGSCQAWFVGCHANVGGGYASDPLSQRSLVWLMGKAAALGLVFREQVVIDETQTAPPINDSYREFGSGFYHFFSKPFYRSVGAGRVDPGIFTPSPSQIRT
jgi:Uncharacterized alpha/beta hydrolase domain (DUF2235)